MVGVSADEILAMKPSGWLVRPFGAGRAGFRMISPGPMPGAYGNVCHHPATPGFQVFAERPEPDLFVLNRALEHPQLVDLLVRWCRDDEQPQPTVPVLSAAVESLLARRLVDVYEDDLHSPTLLLLGNPTRAAPYANRSTGGVPPTARTAPPNPCTSSPPPPGDAGRWASSPRYGRAAAGSFPAPSTTDAALESSPAAVLPGAGVRCPGRRRGGGAVDALRSRGKPASRRLLHPLWTVRVRPRRLGGGGPRRDVACRSVPERPLVAGCRPDRPANARHRTRPARAAR